jgi:trans-aconitate methyltransferase
MTDSDLTTIATYDKSPKEWAEYFNSIGARVRDIEQALQLAGNPENARVVEIGCGDGRDAKEIVKRVGWYQGFDPSVGFLALAKDTVPRGDFVLADAQSYEFPADVDVVFAFASLLHVSKSELPAILGKVHAALRQGGILFVSLKEKDEYTEAMVSDKLGERMFYFYNSTEIEELAGDGFEPVYIDHQVKGKTKWFTMALKKK